MIFLLPIISMIIVYKHMSPFSEVTSTSNSPSTIKNGLAFGVMYYTLIFVPLFPVFMIQIISMNFGEILLLIFISLFAILLGIPLLLLILNLSKEKYKIFMR
jgi:hypothetical protein